MPKPFTFTLYKTIRKSGTSGGNLRIYIPKEEAAIFHLKPGMQLKLIVEIIEEPEQVKEEEKG